MQPGNCFIDWMRCIAAIPERWYTVALVTAQLTVVVGVGVYIGTLARALFPRTRSTYWCLFTVQMLACLLCKRGDEMQPGNCFIDLMRCIAAIPDRWYTVALVTAQLTVVVGVALLSCKLVVFGAALLSHKLCERSVKTTDCRGSTEPRLVSCCEKPTQKSTDGADRSSKKGTVKEATCPTSVETVSNPSPSGADAQVSRRGRRLVDDGKAPRAVGGSLTEPETSVADRVAKYNNLPGTLTDRHAHKSLYVVHLGESVTFDDLVAYCVSRDFKELQGLPPRKSWGAVNPVLLMEDVWDSETKTVRRRYVITPRGFLASMESGVVCYYNEVFLPGRPVSRLNLDVDLKCCASCKDEFSANASRGTKASVSKVIGASVIDIIAESLVCLTREQVDDGERDQTDTAEIAKAVGKVLLYMRAPSTTGGSSKISLRLLWYLPIELCSATGISAYDSLLKQIEQVSLSHVLLSYKKDECGFCHLKADTRALRVKLSDVSSRQSAIDKAPYVVRKCVRLPNCYKEETRFEYMGTINRHDVHESDNENVHSVAIGLSSSPVQSDVTTLGSPFAAVLSSSRLRTGFTFVTNSCPNVEHVQQEAARLSNLWNVPVTVNQSSNGSMYIVQASQKSQYPCPVHKRIHSTFRLRAIVFAENTITKCFVN